MLRTPNRARSCVYSWLLMWLLCLSSSSSLPPTSLLSLSLSPLSPKLRAATSRFTTSVDMKRAVIIGGGPSGYFSAITLANRAKGGGIPIDVDIIEATGKPLKKVLISGGGRCNLLPNTALQNKYILEAYPIGRGRKELISPMRNGISPGELLSWFNDKGVETKVESDGRTFPVTDDSRTVEQCLRNEADRLKIKLHTKTLVKSLVKESEKGIFVLDVQNSSSNNSDRSSNGGKYKIKADVVIMATGSSRSGYDLASSLGHTIIKPLPSLFTLSCKECAPGEMLHDLQGIASKKVKMTIHGEHDKRETCSLEGPILVTHVGLSGPVALKTSAYMARTLHDANYKAKIILDWAPMLSTDHILQMLNKYKATNGKRGVRTSTPHVLTSSEANIPKRLWVRILDVAKVKEEKIWAEVTKKEIAAITSLLKTFQLTMVGKVRG